MTRFARAKGSKASNLKEPQDSTPWEVMKEQMLKSKKDNEDNKNREEAEKQRIENYNHFLKEQKTQKRKAIWCEFSEIETKKKINSPQKNDNAHETKNKKKKFHHDQITIPISQENNVQNGVNNGNEEKQKLKKNKNKKKKLNNVEQGIDSSPKKVNEVNETTKLQNNKSFDIINSTKQNNGTDDINHNINQSEQKSKKKRKKNKKQKQFPLSTVDYETNTSLDNVEKGINQVEDNMNEQKTEKKKMKKIKKLKQVSESKLSADNKKPINNTEKQINNVNKNVSLRKKKDKGEKPGRRKPINDRSFQLIINSKEVELMRFDGFPIMKKDAERLEELKKNMMKKGIPKSEVQRTMKLERRRAEKALARLKREVCYNCRKGGHNLSDCPDLKSNIPGSAEGVCFKCGSTEHRQFECKVQRDKEFRFATCFICKESGHIARQCPDNPKGLYPNGGCCKLCGDVTHLRKDCPTVKEQKEGSSIKLQTLNDENIEDISQNVKPVSEEAPKKPKKIKF